MNLMAKLKAMQREIDALRARVEALESDDAEPLTTEQFRSILDSMPLAKPIVDAPPIASATIAPPPQKRGRPPTAT